MSTERNDLQTVLDAEREKVKALLAAVGEQVAEDEDIPLACAVVEELHANVETLTAQLSQLKALVRAYFKARSGNDQNEYVQAYAALKATLDATPTATPTHNGGA